MIIRGISKLTLLDFPGHIACTVFTGGCNFRCPYCHNAGLVLDAPDYPEIPEDEFFDFLESRKNKLEGVCITGGEPTLNSGLPEFIKKIKQAGFNVKLDTNGYLPDVLEDLIKSGDLDMIAMDIKNSPEKYALTAGLDETHFDLEKIKRSVEMIKNSGIAYEFRTTVARPFHELSDMTRIGEWLAGPSPYFIQNYK
ncbi:MAG: anaerobic ribonucleoside-triphosphate reductase activating protein, partial [Lachnospiraceae bacterium]|nr:anaerobic ribonucleoside-triphosphate reductase activating protein [Lachnospiraceae bacterium]